MIRSSVLVLAVLAASPSLAAVEIPPAEIAYQVLALIDMGQTLDIAENPDKFHEMNSLEFPSHPSKGRVIATFTLGSMIHYGVTYAMVNAGASSTAVNIWEAATIGLEVTCIAHNYHIGLKAKF